jgi:hypothetical protein
VRVLDFQIFCNTENNHQPVVATSSAQNHYVMESYNFVPFSEVFAELLTNAFSADAVPNPADPLILYFRFSTNEHAVYQSMANMFASHDDLFMHPQYSYESDARNFGAVKLADCMGKILIFVDKSTGNSSFMDCADFYEYVNLVGGTPNLQAYSAKDLENCGTCVEDLQVHNQNFMTIIAPSYASGAPYINMNSASLRVTGSQFICMMYQFNDPNLQECITFYNSAGHAFVLKDADLRPDPSKTTIEVPAQDPKASYAVQTVKSPFFTFSV